MTDSKTDNDSVKIELSSVASSIQSDERRITTGSKAAVDKDDFLFAHRDLNNELIKLQVKNNILHRRLAEYYKKRKLEHVLKPIQISADLEEKYYQKLYTYEELKQKEEMELAEMESKLHVVEVQYDERHEHVDNVFKSLQQLERSTGCGLIYSKKGKPISDKTVDRYLKLQKLKNQQCSALRLRYIRAKNVVSELDAIVRKLEKLGPGLYVAHYEQLFIDYQNYMNKIEEKEDELIRNRGKCTEHNQILAHIREKMHHTDEQIDLAECDLGEAEIDYTQAREELGYIKNHRDRLRYALIAEKQKAGLLTRKDLLRDLQKSINEVEKLKQRKEKLKAQIAANTMKLREARQHMQNPGQPIDSTDDFD